MEKQRGLYWLSRDRLQTSEARGLQSEVCNLKSNNTWLRFIQREKIAQKKLSLVRNILKIIRFIPGLRGLFVCGSVARKICSRRSDIDFLILTQKTRVWTVRFFLTIFSFLLGRKTQDGKSRYNKFCLNHYRSASKLKLEEQLQDLYSAQEYAQMVNLYSRGKIENKFFEENKGWMGRYIPNFNFAKPALISRELIVANRKSRKIIKILEDGLEKLLQKLQTAKVLKTSRRFAGLDNRRIVTDNEVIMFHLNPRSPTVLKKFQQIADKFKIFSF